MTLALDYDVAERFWAFIDAGDISASQYVTELVRADLQARGMMR